MSPFYSEQEIDELTGIRRGSAGQSKLELQCAFFRTAGIPFIKNARGRPVVTRTAIEGRMNQPPEDHKPPVKGWTPKLIGA